METLFLSGNCKPGQSVILTAYSGRDPEKSFRARQIQINVLDENEMETDVQLLDIVCLTTSQIVKMSKDTKISTSYFKDLIFITFTVFGSSERQGLSFEFYNPLKENVKIYITLLGEHVSSDLIGQTID